MQEMNEKSMGWDVKPPTNIQSGSVGWALSTSARMTISRAAITTRFESKEKAARQRLICRQCNNFA
jgi:hypothetical protein